MTTQQLDEMYSGSLLGSSDGYYTLHGHTWYIRNNFVKLFSVALSCYEGLVQRLSNFSYILCAFYSLLVYNYNGKRTLILNEAVKEKYKMLPIIFLHVWLKSGTETRGQIPRNPVSGWAPLIWQYVVMQPKSGEWKLLPIHLLSLRLKETDSDEASEWVFSSEASSLSASGAAWT